MDVPENFEDQFDIAAAVAEFHRAFGLPVRRSPVLASTGPGQGCGLAFWKRKSASSRPPRRNRTWPGSPMRWPTSPQFSIGKPSAATSEPPPCSATRLDRRERRCRARGQAVHIPWRRSGRGSAELRGKSPAGVIDSGRPSLGSPACRHSRHCRRIGDLAGCAFHDEIEVVGGETQCATWVAGKVACLPRPLARLEPEGSVGPESADARYVGAGVRVDCRQPARVTVRAAGARRLGNASI